ncbi:hypothetical protein BDB00DRAFT_834551 [Zychaea mexicana]|uniref:uncharacterized protein n=1 Tax=Zychaea mexicana TaxID=64656 RepID=UPI0022FEDA89|nr:uncharacterized protein BDB00DRAFT_834551 [Zychaea mexicana]KAI9491117.1 hypothetical protein BDB00DRAFT_834551 [Zychaea mexicana]
MTTTLATCGVLICALLVAAVEVAIRKVGLRAHSLGVQHLYEGSTRVVILLYFASTSFVLGGRLR